MTDERFTILVVCHANLCRSPMAERLFRHALDERLGEAARQFNVYSAGVQAWTGHPMHPLAAEVLREHGIDDGGFRTQRVTPGLVSRSDLVLTATRQQRSHCVDMEPAAVKRTFTLPHFGRLAAEVSTIHLAALRTPQARLRGLIEQVPMVRGQLPVPSAEEDELADPVRYPIEVFRRCAGEIRRVVDVMTGLIAPK